MRIIVDLRLLAKGRFSGVEEYTRSLVGQLLKADEKNDYFFFYNAFRKSALPQAWSVQPKLKLIDWRVPNRLLDFSFRWLNWPKIDSILPADIVYSPHLNLLRTAKAKRIITFHDLSFFHFPEFFLPRKRYWHWSQDYRRQAETAAAVVTDSDFTKSDLIQTFRLSPDKVHVFYPGINDFYKFLPPQSEELTRFANQHDLNRPFLLYVGVLEPRKNIPALIQAFNFLKTKSENRDLKLLLVGEKGWLYDRILKEISGSPYKNQIVVWGRASLEDLRRLYNLASVFVYPSFFEGFGFPPLEAQACGLPVVASNRASLPEVLGNSALLHDPWRVTELAAAIEAVLGQAELSRTLRERGFENVKKFTWQKTAKALLSLFKDIYKEAQHA